MSDESCKCLYIEVFCPQQNTLTVKKSSHENRLNPPCARETFGIFVKLLQAKDCGLLFILLNCPSKIQVQFKDQSLSVVEG